MTARASSWDIGNCGPPVPVVSVNGAGEELEGLEAMTAGAGDDVVVAGFGRWCVGVGVVATGVAEVTSISASSGDSKKGGELGRVGTSKN